MNYPAATVATSISGDPEVGPEITTTTQKNPTKKQRVLIGWNHQNDDPASLLHGKLWCWVSENGRFEVFHTTFNRAKVAGEVRFCGVANFTMVRMFHPYWCPQGRVPRDMNWSDKYRCRYNYRQLIRKWRIAHNLEVDTELDNPIQPAGSNRKRRRPQRQRRASERSATVQEYFLGDNMGERGLMISHNSNDSDVSDDSDDSCNSDDTERLLKDLLSQSRRLAARPATEATSKNMFNSSTQDRSSRWPNEGPAIKEDPGEHQPSRDRDILTPRINGNEDGESKPPVSMPRVSTNPNDDRDKATERVCTERDVTTKRSDLSTKVWEVIVIDD